MNARQILLRLNRERGGGWDAMYQAIRKRERLSDDEIAIGHDCITIVDAEYPEKLKKAFKPPFTVFYEGDIGLLGDDGIVMIAGNDETPQSIVKAVSELSKSHVIASYCDSAFDKEILRACMRNGGKFIIATSKCLDDIDRGDDIIRYATDNGCLIITEYGFASGTDDYASYMRHRLISPFLHGVLLASSVKSDPKISLLVEDVCNGSGNVWALPEPPFADSFNNRLLRDGATLIDSSDDIELFIR